MKLPENDRKLIWDELTQIEYQMKNLKSIVQNSIDISLHDVSDWLDMKNTIINDLNQVHIKFVHASHKSQFDSKGEH